MDAWRRAQRDARTAAVNCFTDGIKDIKMHELNRLGRSHGGWRNGLMILAGAAFLVATAMAEEKPVVGASNENSKAATRVSPHVLAAQRRAQQEEEMLSPRVGLQSQMHREAVRRHLAPARLGT
jgi:hypothetical protein